MSSISKPIVELCPPVLTAFNRFKETFTSHGHTCPYCNGKGAVCGRQTGDWEYDAETCPVCDGKGSLQAEIIIRWTPENIC
jgi:DnaJ-class molecular chaperone